MMMSPYNLAEVITGSPFAKPVDRPLLLEKSERVSHLTSSLRHPKILIKEFSYFLMPCHQHGLRINLLV